MCSTPLWSNQKILYQPWTSSKPLNLRCRKQQRKKCFHLWLKSPNWNCVSNVEKSSGPFPAKAAFLIESPLVWHHLNEARRDTKRPFLVRIAGSEARWGAGKFLRIPHLIVHMLSDYLRSYLNVSRYLFICPSQGECVFFCGRLSISPVCLSGSWLLQAETNKDKLSFLQSHLAWHSF